MQPRTRLSKFGGGSHSFINLRRRLPEADAPALLAAALAAGVRHVDTASIYKNEAAVAAAEQAAGVRVFVTTKCSLEEPDL